MLLLVQLTFQFSDAFRQAVELLVHRVFQVDLVHIVGVVHGLSGHADDAGRHAHGGGVGRDLAEDHGAGGDAGVVSHGEGTQHLGAGAHQHVIAQGGVALALILAGAAQGHALVQGTAVSHLGGLADDDAAAVVDEHAGADFGAGMDLHTGEEPPQLGQQPCQKEPFVTVKKMYCMLTFYGRRIKKL